MPAEPPLTDVERTVLNVLMAPGSRSINCTVQAVGHRAGLDIGEAARALRGLAGRDPPLVREDVDEGAGVRFYMSTYDAAEALDER